MAENTSHISVLLPEVLTGLRAAKGGLYLDCTLGGAGHTRAILEAHEENRVVAIDRDERAILRAHVSLTKFKERIEILKGAFSDIPSLVAGRRFDGVLADLGISSDQLSEQRGFSFNDHGPLDMRMDENAPLTAEVLINERSEQELFQLLKEGGVGEEARPVARAMVRARPIATTRQLAEVIAAAIPARITRRESGKKTNPATVVFQAIRMAVNNELEEISALHCAIPEMVSPGGRVAIIAFHSLEDKLVTRAMRGWEHSDDTPALWPGAHSAPRRSFGRLLTRKAITPTEGEMQRNPRSRSARLRVFEFNQ